MTKSLRNERGGTLVLYTLSMVVMMGMAALAIDLGFLRKARAEAQRAADAASLAGASAFTEDLPRAAESTLAVTRAYRVADTNYMNGVHFDTTAGEVIVKVIPDSVKVRVTARRANVPTWFARVFGLLSVPIGAKAAAEASWASGASCVKPIVMPDLWDDGDNDTNGDNLPNGTEQWLWNAANDVYHPAHWDSDGNGQPNDGAGTGLGSELRNLLPAPGERDWGRQVILQPSVNGGSQACTGTLQGNKCYTPGWWGWWGGSPKTRENMLKTCAGEAELGVTIDVETGWTNTLRQAIDDVIATDPGASWNPTATDSITGKTGTVAGSTFGNKWIASKRVWIVAMVAPGDVPAVPSDHNTVFNNFMSFFVEGCVDSGNPQGWVDCSQGGPNKALVGRFVGAAKGNLSGPNPGSMNRMLRLVE